MTTSFASALDRLPVFASDKEIAVALCGPTRAKAWLERLPVLEAKVGFPKIDPLHNGRPVPLVRLFYANYLRLPASGATGVPDGEENPAAWRSGKKTR